MGTLLETQSISEINVSELCRVAGIHRTTFYKHFSSVTEFASHTFGSLIHELSAVDEDSLPASAAEAPEHYRRAMESMLDYVAANRTVYRRLFASDGDHTFQRIIADELSKRAEGAHRQLGARGRSIEVDETTAARMVGAACTAALGVWAEQEETDSARRSAEIIAALPPWWQAG